MTITEQAAQAALDSFKDSMWRDGELPAMQAAVSAALSHSPVEQENGTGAEARKIIARFLAEKAAFSPQSGGLTADDYMSFGGIHEQADKLLERLQAANASIAHTFHIDPVSRESVRDEVEDTQSPAPNLVAAGEQWRAIEDGQPKTSWFPLGYGDKPGWDAIANRLPNKYRVETRTVYALAAEGQAE